MSHGRNLINDSKIAKCSRLNVFCFLWSKPEVSIFKTGGDMANHTNFKVCKLRI